MSRFRWRRKANPEQLVRDALLETGQKVGVEFEKTNGIVSGLFGKPDELKPLVVALYRLAEVGAALRRSQSATPLEPLVVTRALRDLTEKLYQALRAEPAPNCLARRTLARALNHVIDGEAEISHLLPALSAAEPCAGRRIVVPADLLYQAHHELFPPERMLISAGRVEGNTIHLGATFDVTGEHSSGGVKADPKRLARALIGMSVSGTHLACWIHSHPGTGSVATTPSPIDRRQQADWIRNYSKDLLGIILVEDGWVRLWGTSLEAGQSRVEVIGSGILKDKKHEHLYRLAE